MFMYVYVYDEVVYLYICVSLRDTSITHHFNLETPTIESTMQQPHSQFIQNDQLLQQQQQHDQSKLQSTQTKTNHTPSLPPTFIVHPPTEFTRTTSGRDIP